jgi:hypothetical protein
MAYEFVAASNQYLVTSSTPVTSTPLTMACWGIKNLATEGRELVGLVDSAGSDRIVLGFVNTGIAARVNTAVANAGTNTLGVWRHAAGVFASSTSRTAYANGGAGATNTTDVTATAINSISIGARGISPVINYHDGLIAEVGIWDVALTAAEIASLAAGVTCDKVRPQSLRFYAPLIRDLQDLRGGLTITNTNTATVADHPRVYK